MKKIIFIIAFLLTGINTNAQQNLIFETDMGNDVDDVLAIDMLYKYAHMGKINLMAVMLNKEGTYPPQFIDLLNTWYGFKKLPIGLSNTDVNSIVVGTNYTEVVVNSKNVKGKPLYKRTLKDMSKLPSAVELYRKLLAKAPDHSVTIVSVGFSTNLAKLMATDADKYSPLTGMKLIEKKVSRLVTMAGHMQNPEFAEYNVLNDISSCKKVFDEWPTPIYTSPFELGLDIKYPGKSILSDFGWTVHHPIVDAYKNYLPTIEDRPTWDLTAVLYSVDPQDMFNVSESGIITVTKEGYTQWKSNSSGKHHYLTTTPQQKKKIRDYFLNIIPKDPLTFRK